MIDHKIQTLLRDNRQIRLHILFVLWASPEPVAITEIAAALNVNRGTIGDWLPAMEADGYVCHFGSGRWNRWTVTTKYRQLPLPGLVSASNSGDGGKFPIIPSSSSDLIYPSGLRSDQKSEEEEESTPQERLTLADNYQLTGDYRTTVLNDPWITKRRFEAWFEHAANQKKRSPAAYAVQCCANHHEPPEPENIGKSFARDMERYRSRQDSH